MKKFNLSEKIGVIDFSKNFVLSFDYLPREGDGFDYSDFEFKLSFGPNALKISNVLPSKIYKTKASKEYILKRVGRHANELTFLSDSLLIIGAVVYKLHAGEVSSQIKDFFKKGNETFVLTDEYELIEENETRFIKRYNPTNSEGSYLRPTEVKLLEGKTVVAGSQSYFQKEDSPFDTSKANSYQIVVSNNGQTITLKALKNGIFETIKTLSFSQGVERAEIILEVDGNMDLRNLQFSFLKSHVE